MAQKAAVIPRSAKAKPKANQESFESFLESRAKKVKYHRDEDTKFKMPNYAYVAWIDIMGAGNLMETSIDKTANAIAKLHLAVHHSTRECRFDGRILRVNDGVFIVTPKKQEILTVLRSALVMLAASFIKRKFNSYRFLVRSAIAYGPVYYGDDLKNALKSQNQSKSAQEAVDTVMFGPPIIHAFRTEKESPVYGVAIHESARAFSPKGILPFQRRVWYWWESKEDENYKKCDLRNVRLIKDEVSRKIKRYFEYLDKTWRLHGIEKAKVPEWKELSKQYFTEYSENRKS